MIAFDDNEDPADDPETELDEEFPLGDGDAETVVTVYCPYCGEPNDVTLDPGSGEQQEYVEDCQVCCRPWWVEVSYDRAGNAHVDVRAEDA